MYNEAIIAIQAQIYEQTNRRTDAHYKEGYGVIFVPEGADLIPQNIITVVDEMQLRLMTHFTI